MISAEDIEAFADDNADATVAIDEAIRRAEKGLPYDRWFDGTSGAKLSMRGAWAYRRTAKIWQAIALSLIEERETLSKASMDASADPMRKP